VQLFKDNKLSSKHGEVGFEEAMPKQAPSAPFDSACWEQSGSKGAPCASFDSACLE
jgi:hypothetical protein